MTRIGFIKRAILAERSTMSAAILWALAAIAVPTLLRIAIAPLVGDKVPYTAYFPSVMFASVLLGWRVGVVVTVLSALVATFLFVPPAYTARLSDTEWLGFGVFTAVSLLIIVFAQTLRRTVIELEAAAQREAFLASELAHRVKNNLALIEAFAWQTRHSTPEAFFEALVPRIQALARAQDLLTQAEWRSCTLPDLAHEALRPFAHHAGLSLAGPACRLPAEACTPLVMALHELATNATKYGALSSNRGRVRLSWRLDEERRLLRLEWEEHDGPPVERPKRKGLGSRLLSAGGGLADVKLSFDPTGVRCTITIDGVSGHEAGTAALPFARADEQATPFTDSSTAAPR